MKQKIIEKLFNNEELTNEEILYISRNCKSEETGIPFNHDEKGTLEACGLHEDSGKVATECLAPLGKSEKRASEAVEYLETSMLANPLLLRVIAFQTVLKSIGNKRSSSSRSDIEDILKEHPDADIHRITIPLSSEKDKDEMVQKIKDLIKKLMDRNKDE